MARATNTSNATPSGSRPQGRPSNGGSTKEKKPARLPSSDEESDSDDEGGKVNLVKFEHVQAQYLNQPVDVDQTTSKLKTILTDLKTLSENLLEVQAAIEDTANDVAASFEQPEELDEDDSVIPEDPAQIKALDKEYRLVRDKIKEVSIRSVKLSELRQMLAQGHEIRNLYQAYEKAIEAPLAEFRALTTRQKYLEDEEYVQFRTGIWETLYDGKATPNMKHFIAAGTANTSSSPCWFLTHAFLPFCLTAEPGDAEVDDDDEIEIGAQQSDFKCPITLTLLKDPMTSSKCPHHFSADAIREMLGAAGAKCPITGCSQFLKIADMRANPGLKKRVEAHVQREKEGRNTQHGGVSTGTQFKELELSDDDEDE